MREIFTSGSVGGAPGNRCFYLEPDGKKRGGADAAGLGGPLVMQVVCAGHGTELAR
jgi:hypothetical protein